jgi:hypothetical protein
MKATCISLGHALSASNSQKQDERLTLGKEYVVLGIEGQGAIINYRILGDDGITPVLQPSEKFKITSPEIPPDWIFRIYPVESEWVITPAAWAGDGFWVAYFDGDADAKSLFERIAMELGARRTQD